MTQELAITYDIYMRAPAKKAWQGIVDSDMTRRYVYVEPRVSGRWFERGEDGAETNCGRVLAWNSPKSVLLARQLTASFRYDEKFETEVEVRFEPEGTQQTRITLIHRNLERFGEDADKLATSLGKGWSGFLKMFGKFAEKNAG